MTRSARSRVSSRAKCVSSAIDQAGRCSSRCTPSRARPRSSLQVGGCLDPRQHGDQRCRRPGPGAHPLEHQQGRGRDHHDLGPAVGVPVPAPVAARPVPRQREQEALELLAHARQPVPALVEVVHVHHRRARDRPDLVGQGGLARAGRTVHAQEAAAPERRRTLVDQLEHALGVRPGQEMPRRLRISAISSSMPSSASGPGCCFALGRARGSGFFWVSDDVRLDAAAFGKLRGLLRYVDGDYQDLATFQAIRRGARRRPAAGALPRHPARAVRTGRRAARQGGLRERGPRHRREAVRPRPRLGAGAQPDPARRVRRDVDLPDRPLPREAAGAPHAVLPLRQRVPRAVLEPQSRRERADHHGGRLRDPGPRRVLRRDRRRPRRGPEPSLPGPEQSGHGAAGQDRQRIDPGREGEGPQGDPARSPRTTSSVDSSAGTGRSRAWRRTRRWRRSSPCALEIDSWRWQGVPVLHPGREVPAGDVHGGRRPAPPAAHDVPRLRPRAELLPLPDQPRRHDRHRRQRHRARGGDAQPDRGDARDAASRTRTRWTRTSGCWATPCTGTPRCSRGRTTSKRRGESSIRC